MRCGVVPLWSFATPSTAHGQPWTSRSPTPRARQRQERKDERELYVRAEQVKSSRLLHHARIRAQEGNAHRAGHDVEKDDRDIAGNAQSVDEAAWPEQQGSGIASL